MLPDQFEGQFDDLQELVNEGNGNSIDLDPDTLNEYGEIEDDTLNVNTPLTESTGFAIPDVQPTNTKRELNNSWLKRSYLAVNESDKEFEMFRVYCLYGGGRSLQYISTTLNIPAPILNKIAQRNNWKRRASDYDTAQLTLKIKHSQDSKHKLHIQKLEQYREEQEVLGKQISLNAARMAFLANNSLSKLIDEERTLDVRDIPAILNTAAKLAEVGKNLQSSSLGVDSLLNAMEEAELD